MNSSTQPRRQSVPEGNLHCAELAADTAVAALKDCLAVNQQPWKKLYRR